MLEVLTDDLLKIRKSRIAEIEANEYAKLLKSKQPFIKLSVEHLTKCINGGEFEICTRTIKSTRSILGFTFTRFKDVEEIVIEQSVTEEAFFNIRITDLEHELMLYLKPYNVRVVSRPRAYGMQTIKFYLRVLENE